MSLKIEAGKFYRMRGFPNKVRIYATDGYGMRPIHGAVTGPAGWEPMAWLGDGRSPRGTEYDLIAEWIDQPEVDWDAMPKWANWVAKDADGDWWFFVEEPLRKALRWYAEGFSAITGFVPAPHAPKWTGDWKQSLVQRPESK